MRRSELFLLQSNCTAVHRRFRSSIASSVGLAAEREVSVNERIEPPTLNCVSTCLAQRCPVAICDSSRSCLVFNGKPRVLKPNSIKSQRGEALTKRERSKALRLMAAGSQLMSWCWDCTVSSWDVNGLGAHYQALFGSFSSTSVHQFTHWSLSQAKSDKRINHKTSCEWILSRMRLRNEWTRPVGSRRDLATQLRPLAGSALARFPGLFCLNHRAIKAENRSRHVHLRPIRQAELIFFSGQWFNPDG